MDSLIIYHGSANIIKNPLFGVGKPYNDYGLGFYTTENIELAKEWACIEGTDGYVNKYTISLNNLNILNLNNPQYTILSWLAILLDNRKIKLSTPNAKMACEYLIDNFMPDYINYDAIIGYRADDSYFMFAKYFVQNQISLSQLNYAMKLGKLGEQFVLKSKKAFEKIEFQDYEIANNEIYYPKRKRRDEEARIAFTKELENYDKEGLFMRDILGERIKKDDLRIR